MQDARNVIRRWRSIKKGMKNNLYVILSGHKEKMSAFKARREKRRCRREQKGCTEVFETAKRRAGEYCILQMHSRKLKHDKTEMIVIILTIMCIWEERKQIFTKRVVNSYNVRKG